MRTIPTAPKPDNVRAILAKLAVVREIGIPPGTATSIHLDRLSGLAREGRLSPNYLIERYTVSRRRAIVLALLIDLEARLIDAALSMADRLVGQAFTRGKNAQARSFSTSARDVSRLMLMFRSTIDALSEAKKAKGDPMKALDEAVGWAKLLQVREQLTGIAEAAGTDPLVRAADRHASFRKFLPALLDAIEFRAARTGDKTVAAVNLMRDMYAGRRREVPGNAPMPFKKEWHGLVKEAEGRIDRKMYETAVLAHLRNKLRSGDMWVERSSGYRRFDSYMVSSREAEPIACGLKLPATADVWLDVRERELDWRLRRFSNRLERGRLEGVDLRDGRLHISPIRTTTPPEADALADRLDALMPRIRVTELLHEVARDTGFLSAFTNLRTGEPCPNENALLAAILADATNLGLARMAEASQGVTRDQLVWTADAYLRDETYKAALARIIDAHHALPIATVWGEGTTSAPMGSSSVRESEVTWPAR